MSGNPYKIAFERERKARQIAEKMLDEKTREVYSTLNMIRSQYENLEQERRKLEDANDTLKSTQHQLIQSEKMASLGQLSAGVAHEINNPVAFVLSNLQMLEEYMESYEKVFQSIKELNTPVYCSIKKVIAEEDIEYIVKDIPALLSESIVGLVRVKDIVTSLNNFARISESKKDPVDINKLIENTVKVVWNQLKYSCQVCFNLTDVPLVECNQGQISQVFVNLMVNASHAIKDTGKKGHITLSTQLEGDYLEVIIRDNGCGMEEDVCARIFEPFYTTKPMGVGTGLGLSVSHGIIEKHGGRIQAQSEVDKGTQFTIHLPLKHFEKSADNIH